MGVFGACYAVKSNLFKPFPSNFIVDDFYITMHVIKNGYQAVHEPKALVLDYNNSTMQSEFNRKVRISTGNFQNLAEYFDLLWQRGWGVGFSFLSHKVLRWIGPFLIITMMLCSIVLSRHFYLFKALLFIQTLLLTTPFFDYLLHKLNIQITILRSISYFYYMNFALLIGFIKYVRGVKTSIWQPLAR
jgi:cellulose synthase/poly-beta-1,6-N-acetylglucosamine synthase-like glycosyltransferase